MRWGSPLTPADLNRRGYAPPKGPVLAETAWDEVLVVLARSLDGVALDLTLEPRGDSPLETVPLHFTQLAPAARYELSVDGSDSRIELVADDAGSGSVTLPLHARARIRLEPTR